MQCLRGLLGAVLVDEPRPTDTTTITPMITVSPRSPTK